MNCLESVCDTWVNNPKYPGKTGIQYKSVLFVPVTKGGLLAKELRKQEEEINRYSTDCIKIVESGGMELKLFLLKCLICHS